MSKIIKNKSFIYIFPLIIRYFKDNNDNPNIKGLIGNIINTYIYFKNKNKVSKIVLECKKNKTDLDFILKDDKFDKLIETESTIIFILKIDESFQDTYKLYIEGKYSKICDKDKATILQFAHVNFDMELFKTVSGVLNKKNEYKKFLEKKLQVTIPDDIELSSKINEDAETFVFEIE